ncbi:MAG: hypothetical protein Q9209_004593 [Squamulea sp. 1 TL-2023]
MPEDIADHMRTSIPWDQFTKKHGIDGERFESRAAKNYHCVKKRLWELELWCLGREKQRQKLRDEREYMKMFAKEYLQKRKLELKNDLRKKTTNLAAIKNQGGVNYRNLDADIEKLKGDLIWERAQLQEEKKTSKAA